VNVFAQFYMFAYVVGASELLRRVNVVVPMWSVPNIVRSWGVMVVDHGAWASGSRS
jgi:hypothetical protein